MMPEYTHVLFVIQPWWRRPFSRDLAGPRALLRYRLVRKPIGADWSETEPLSAHWTHRRAIETARLVRVLMSAAPTTPEAKK